MELYINDKPVSFKNLLIGFLIIVLIITWGVNIFGENESNVVIDNPMDDGGLFPDDWEGDIGREGWYPGKITEDGLSQEMPVLVESGSHQRFKELANDYNLDPSVIWEVENKYNLREGLVLAITIAETSGGKRGNYVSEGCYNYGNVANNDRGNRHCYDTPKESIEAIGRVLNNQYLGSIQTLGCLSNAGSCPTRDDNGHRYATSNGNWERTISNVLNAIYGEELGAIEPHRFSIRRNYIPLQ